MAREVSGEEKLSVLRKRRTRRRRRRNSCGPTDQSKVVQEILADLKNPCFVDDVMMMMMTIQVQRAGGGFDLF